MLGNNGLITKFTTNDESTGNISPIIYEDKMVWQAYDGNDDEIFYYDGTKTIQLTDNDYDDLYPQISK